MSKKKNPSKHFRKKIKDIFAATGFSTWNAIGLDRAIFALIIAAKTAQLWTATAPAAAHRKIEE